MEGFQKPQSQPKNQESQTPSMSRRGFLFGAAAIATGFASRPAHAENISVPQKSQESAGFTPEQQKAYSAGLRELRHSAQEDMTEVRRVFVAHSNGTGEWVALSGQNATGDHVDVDPNKLHIELMEAKNGATVIDAHTHPIKANLDTPERIKENPDVDRVPPSPTDIMNDIMRRAGFDGAWSSNIHTHVITSAGVWKHGPKTPDANAAFVKALNAPWHTLHELTKTNESGAHSLGAFLRANGIEGAELYEQNMVDRAYQNYPLILAELTGVVPQYLSHADIPADAREYALKLKEACDIFLAALQTIDPKTDGKIASSPDLASGKRTGFPEYVKRWEGLGINLQFEEYTN